MKKAIIVIFLGICFLFANAQKKIYISEWINEPPKASFTKPLIFIDFFATWCAPCIVSMPHIHELEEEFKDDILFFYLSNETKERVEAFMNKRNKHFYAAVEHERKSSKIFGIKSIPQSILLDLQGNVIWQGKPSDIDRKQLAMYLKSYKGQTGESSRIVVENMQEEIEEIQWQTFNYESAQIKYTEAEEVSNDFSGQGNEFAFSGELNYLISIVFEVPESRVISYLKVNKKYVINGKARNFRAFKRALKKFLFRKCDIDIAVRRKKQVVYILKDTDNSNLFNKNMYDYEKGDNTFIADDFNITIDNATIEDMTTILSDFSELTFIYQGKDEQKYDWNLHYKNSNYTLEQLSEELGFKVKKENKRLRYYYITDAL